MRIAILSPFHPFRGGMAQFSTSLYLELQKENEIKAFNFKTLYPQVLFPGKTQLVEDAQAATKIVAPRVLSSINPLSYKKTASLINNYNPDVIIIPYWTPFLAPVLGLVTCFLDKNIKIVALVHNAIPHEKRFFDTFLSKFFFKRCDAYIVLSKSVKNDLLELIPNAKILLQQHPIYDHYGDRITKKDACTTLNMDSDKKNLLFFGLIREYKGLDLLIKAMDFLDHSYQLIITGECYGDFEKYQDLIDDSSLKNNIKVFEDYIPDNKVPIFFSAADLLVLPYRSATQSGVVAVAYQMEQPMLSTNVGGLGDAIRSSDAGIVVPDISSESIAKGIKTYFSEGNRERYLENIKSEKKRLSWSSFAEKVIDFLKKEVLD